MFDVSMMSKPHAEKSLIGAALISDAVVDDHSGGVNLSTFESPQLGLIWSKMMKLRSEGKPTKIGQLVAEGCNAEVLDVCSDMVASSLGAETYAEDIRIAHQRRVLAQRCKAVIGMCSEEPETEFFSKEVLDVILSGLDQGTANRDTFTLEEAARETLLDAIKVLESGKTVTGLETGFKGIDRATYGLMKGELVILAARPGMGKTTLALNIARQVAASQQVAFFSVEMPYHQLSRKILATEVGISSQDIRAGMFGRDKIQSIKRAVETFKATNMTIFDSPGITVGYIKSKLHQLKARTGTETDLVVVDYLQLMSDPKAKDRLQEVSALSRNLKLLAKEFNCPVIALSQLSRAVEQRQDKRPLLSDLRESGSIEQDADQVWFVYREGYYDKSNDSGMTELIIAKARDGEPGTVPMTFNGRLSKFQDYDERYDRWSE